MKRFRHKPVKPVQPNRFHRAHASRETEPSFLRMVLLSGGLHLAVAVIFLVGWQGPRLQPKPVYFVNLVNPPVRAPQAGRPDAAPALEKKEPAPKKVEPPKPRPEPAPPKPKPEPKPKPVVIKPPPPKPAPKPEPKPEPKPAPKPEPKPEPRPLVSPQEEKAAQEAIAKLQRERQREKLKEKIAAMQAQDTRTVPAQVGMPEGRGTEAGIDQGLFIKTAIQENWNFSLYQLASPAEAARIEALVMLKYDRSGRLLDYRILRASGIEAFDESLRKAVLKTTQLPHSLGEDVAVEARFNLKEMLERQ